MIQTESKAFELFEITRADLLKRAREIAYYIAKGRANKCATIDDVRENIKLPPGMDGRVMGTVFKTGEWECIGYRKSTQDNNHGRPIGIFRLKEEKVSLQQSLL